MNNNSRNYMDDPSLYQNRKRQKNKRRAKKSKITRIVVVVVLCISVAALLIFGISYYYANNMLNKTAKTELQRDSLSINEEVFNSTEVKNIALFGVDSRRNSFSGRSDAIMVLTIDRLHNKIKLASIARDTYVAIEGRGNDKFTHAYAYGGAELAVKTLNQNFNMDIEDYITTNFFGFVDVIDSLGGVELDVDEQELQIINYKYYDELNELGLTYDRLTSTGLQHLTGAQALAYSRNRYAEGDVGRGNRQKEVLQALFDEVKSVSLTKYPGIVTTFLENCETSLTNGEILEIATWAATNSPKIENLSLPDAECNPKSGADAMLDGVWYYFYDLDIATQKLHTFIKES